MKEKSKYFFISVAFIFYGVWAHQNIMMV